MKVKYYLFILIVFFIGNLTTISGQTIAPLSYDTSDGNYYLKTSDGHEEYAVDGTVTFKTVKSGTIPSYRDAGVTFKPVNSGEIIRITVDEIDLDGSTNYLLIYNGYIKIGYSGASDGSGQASYMPAGWFAKIGATSQGNSYESESEDGQLTIGFHSSSSNSQKGFTITVTSMSMKDMEYVSNGTFLDNSSVPRGGQDRILSGANIITEGGSNPLSLTELSFNTSGLSANNVHNIRIYSSDKFTDATLLAGMPNTGENISITNGFTLKSGNNRFYVVADIQADAIPNSTLPILLSFVKINGESKTIISAKPENTATILNDVLMASGHLTYTISENTNFYDDGGKDGKISERFEGTVTFVPKTEGKKIRIDFSKLEIFNTSSTGLNDIFKFYNGHSADENQLIATLLKETEIIKSTADDGSLTVTLKSTTGIPANGWEAVVSEFIPGPMEYSDTTTEKASVETIAAGNTNEPIVIFNIKTINTLTPLEVQSVKIDASSTANITNLSNAKIYFLGKTNTFSTDNLFGEIIISENNFEIAGNQSLIEGNNYFALVYDINEKATNENNIAASVASIKVSGTEHTVSGEIQQRIIKNEFKAVTGNYVKTIYEDWIYSDSKSPYNPTYYDYTDEDRIITFIPGESGKVVEIDFSSFDVYYSDSAYGTKAVFEIYNGTGITGDILWKLDSNAKSSTGPDKKIRSTASNGAITIRFNAKATSSYYAGKGWNALISLFLNSEMKVSGLNTFQENTSDIKPGSINQEIIGLEIITTGNLTTLTANEIKLNLKDSYPFIDKVNILYSAGIKDFNSSVEFGSVNNPSQNEIIVTGNQNLPEGTNYFWVSYDMKSGLENDEVIDASLISVKFGEETLTPAEGDPEGQRLTKNEIWLQNGENGQITVNQPLTFYDDGGPNANYSIGYDGQITFLPSSPDKIIKLEFDEFHTITSHYLYVYNGKEVNEDNLIGKYSLNTYPESLISASEDGAVTLRFVSISTSTSSFEGWKIQVSSYTPLDLFVENITTFQEGEETIVRGSANEAVQKIVVKVGGDKGNLTLNNFKFNSGNTTSTSDIENARLYYTGSSSGFIADNQFGETSTTFPLTFTSDENAEITLPGEYYFWLAYTINTLSATGNKVGARLENLVANNTSQTTITEENTVERIIKSGFKGTYIIGTSENADYPNFTSAVTALQGGVEGSVLFKAEAGTYPENILIQNVKGSSAKHSITFTSLSGKNDDVIISGAGYNAPAYGGTTYGMVAVENTGHVTFENMSFIPASQSYPYNVHIRDRSRYFTLRNSILTANTVTTGYEGTNMFYMEPINEEGRNNDYVTVEGNTITGGYIGLYMGGTSYVALTNERGAVIKDNMLIEQGSKGIYIFDEDDALIENNTISSSLTQKTSFNGIDIFRNKGKLIIRNNRVTITQPYYAIGIYLRQETEGNIGEPALIYNNAVSITNAPNTSTYGINLTGDGKNIEFYYNTINISGTGGYAMGITGSYEVIKNIVFQNNLIQNNTSSPLYYFNKESQYKSIVFKNNAYHLAGSKFTNNWGNTFTDWIANSGETNSIEEKADFLSNTDLHLKEAGNLQSALPLSFISTDLEAKVRNDSTPTIGAYEYETIIAVTPEMDEGYPKVSTVTIDKIDFKTQWNQSGIMYSIIRKADETAPTKEELLTEASLNINNSEEKIVSFTGLEKETEYKAYFLLISVLHTESEIVETEIVKTLKEILPLSVTLKTEWNRINTGTEVDLYPDSVSGGVEPYSYEWKNSKNETLSTNEHLIISPAVTSQFILTVKDSGGNETVLYTVIPVTGEAQVATYDDLYLASESYWRGNSNSTESTFYSGSYSFSNTYYPDWNYWGGFAYSNLTDTSFDYNQFNTHQFRSTTSKGVENSKNFSVLYAMGARTEVNIMHDPSGDIVPGVYLTNAAWTYADITQGTGVATAFGQGDYYKVIFKGTQSGGQTSTVEYYLADYRSSNPDDWYALTEWKWFDLSVLGKVTKVSVSIDGSDSGQWGLNTAAYLCMDNFGAEDPGTLSVEDIQEKASSLKIYPVPAKDILYIRTAQVNYNLKIYSITGSLVLTDKGTGNTQINVANLPAGMYILEMNSKNGREIKRFLKE